ncbi:uroporphyrinogen-III C-methyltransferase [Crenothrix sp.]|uniref:uroporphyrinogen-III C-methyltransferase n=1 Tax=Crenothrix sp. TaxID=3100433 RepID=UPI00374DDE5B
MAELIEQQESPVGENKHPPRSRGGFWFGATILLLVIGLAGVGFFVLSQLRAKQEGFSGEVRNEMTKQLGGYQTQLAAIESQIAALQADISNKDARFNKTISDFSNLHNEKLDNTRKDLGESILKLQRQLGKTRGDWLIADAEYLLSVANERLYLIGDVNTTRQALEAADQRLRESGDASAFKVRDQVIKDIAALTDVKSVDVVGLYSSIQALESRVNNLVLSLPYAGKLPEISGKSTDSDDSLLGAAKNKLSEIVTIKHSDKSVKEILTPEQAQFIREQLRVKLEIVKIALVQQNEPLYKAGLVDVKQWVDQQFTQNSETKAFVAELNRFESIKIRSQFPDISVSLKMLRDITNLRIETDKGMQPEPTSSNDTGVDAQVVEGEKSIDPVKPVDSVQAPDAAPVQAVPSVTNVQVEPKVDPKLEVDSVPLSQLSMPKAAPVQPSAEQVEPKSEPIVNSVEEKSPSTDGQQPAESNKAQNQQPEEDKPLAAKVLEKIKQYLPGNN